MKNYGNATGVSADPILAIRKVPARLDQEQQQLVLEHRTQALRTSHHLLKRWRLGIERDDIISLTDAALCEAALRFQSDAGAKFSTYLFYFLKGAVIQLVTQRIKERNSIRSVSGDAAAEEQPAQRALDQREAESFDEERSNASPHRPLLLAEMRQRCREAIAKLSETEREVVIDVHLHEKKLTAVARRLGYSRGHLSCIRRQAFEKVRPMLEPYKMAG